MAKAKPIWMNPWLAGAAIVAVTLAVYIPAVNAGFFSDDEWLLHGSPAIKADDGLLCFWFPWVQAPEGYKVPDYWPLTWTSLWVEWRMWGMAPAGYHVTNILLHAAAALLAWRVLVRLGVPGAWLAGGLFAVHPVNVESVAWISERKNTLAMVFYLLTALAYLRCDRGARRGWYAACLVFFALSLLSKTAVVMLPVALLIVTWWRRGRLGLRDLALAAPMLAMSLALGIVTIIFDRAMIGDTIIRPEGVADRIAASGWIAWFYLYKAVVPMGLSLIYTRWRVDGSTAAAYVPLVLLAGCFAALWLVRGTRWPRPLLVGLGCFIVILLPLLGLIDDPYWTFSLVADRHQYFALVAVVALAGAGAAKLIGRAGTWRRRAGVPVVLAVVVALTALTWHRAALFADHEALWRDTLAKNPDAWAPRSSLVVILREQGRIDEMIALCEDSVAHGGRYESRALNDLAWLLAAWPDEAVRDGPRAVRLAERAAELTGRKKPMILDTLAAAYAEVGRFDEAVRLAEQAIRLAEAAISPESGKADKTMLAGYRSRLELYRAGRPCRDEG